MTASTHRTPSLNARIVAAFTAFGIALGGAFVALAWAASHGAAAYFVDPLQAAIAGGAIIALLGLALGRILARRVLIPFEQLGDVIDTTPPEQLADTLAEGTFDSEIQALASRLEEALRRTQDHVSREQRFTRYASHELRSPVAVIRGAAELLADMSEIADGPARRPLARIERSVADMQSIIDAFVWLGKERAELDGAATDVGDAVRKTADRYRHLLADKPVAVEIRDDANPTVAAPPAVFDLVVGNLIANAFHYTERGSVTIAIEPFALSVEDTGPGIPADELDTAGDSFVRGDRSVGYGIGLSIVQSLAERLGWRLWLDSEPGHGTTARLYFSSGRSTPCT